MVNGAVAQTVERGQGRMGFGVFHHPSALEAAGSSPAGSANNSRGTTNG